MSGWSNRETLVIAKELVSRLKHKSILEVMIVSERGSGSRF